MVEITGIAGALQIYGCGTAMFLAQDLSGRSFALRVHNCLFGGGQFNLLSVSQLSQKAGQLSELISGLSDCDPSLFRVQESFRALPSVRGRGAFWI